MLGQGTTQEDMDEALWVMQRQHLTNPKATTWIDLELHHSRVDPARIGLDDVTYDDIPMSQLSTGMDQIIGETTTAKKIKDGLEKVRKRDNNHIADGNWISECKKSEARKRFDEEWRSFFDDSKVTDLDIEEICVGIEKVFQDKRESINRKHGKEGGGEGEMELFGYEGAGGRSPLKKTRYGALGPKSR